MITLTHWRQVEMQVAQQPSVCGGDVWGGGGGTAGPASNKRCLTGQHCLVAV